MTITPAMAVTRRVSIQARRAAAAAGAWSGRGLAATRLPAMAALHQDRSRVSRAQAEPFDPTSTAERPHGRPTSPAGWPAHRHPDVATLPLFGPVAPAPMGHPALPTPLRPLNPGPSRRGSRHGKGAERDAAGHLGGLPARRPATG